MTKQTTIQLVPLICAAFLASATLLHAGAEAKQPHMESALHYLQDAKKAENPLPLLNSAKEELHRGAHNKHGFRDTSMDIVEAAIALAQSGDRQKTEEKINAAIANIHDAMAHAPGSR
ncbi:MAG: hypothetical protein WDN28_17055 [Chthoniobacter sp.]